MTDRHVIGAQAALEQLPLWTGVRGRDALFRRFRFADFDAAMAFMNQVAASARLLDHHPEWLNVYNRVEVTLSTHDAGGVTALDVALAKAMDQAAQQAASS